MTSSPARALSRTDARAVARAVAAAGLALAAMLVLSGCTANESGTSGDSAAGAQGETFADSGAAPAAAPEAAEQATTAQAAVGSASGTELAADSARQVITTASATVTVDDPAATAGRIAVQVEGAGGRVEQRSVQTPQEGPASAQLTLRVPADSLNQTVEGLADLGDVSDVQVTATDVTAQATDLDARIAALRTSTERLTALLAGADSTEEVVAAEGALTQRQAELDSLTSQRELLAGQVQLATLSIFVAGREAPPVVEAGGFLGGLLAGWNALVASVAGLLVVAGAVLPWLVTVALVAAVVLLVTRAVRRVRAGRRAGRRAVAPAAPAEEQQP